MGVLSRAVQTNKLLHGVVNFIFVQTAHDSLFAVDKGIDQQAIKSGE